LANQRPRFSLVPENKEATMGEARIDPHGRLEGRAALVTGASRGIGAAIAARLAMEGAAVAISARTQAPGESRLPGTLGDTARAILAAGGTVHAIKADLALASERVRLVAEAVAAVGPIDILVNNAAVTFFQPVAQFTDKRFRLMFEVQVHAPFHLAQLVLPEMVRRRRGWIVNISSGAAIHPKPPYGRVGGAVYGMCKAALERFSTGLAAEVAGDGIAVNAVSPGLVATPGVAVHGLINEATRDRVQPIKFIAEAVLRLASGDPATLTGRIAYAEPLLEELGVEPAELIAGL
jgi:NAD(P)-dependent dehydrogenase (short-subunit alcohol dehydrogenase family)